MSHSKTRKKPNHEYRHGDLRASLIAAALESIKKNGEVEFSLRDLATTAGVTHAASYRHFSSKKEILLAIAAEGYSILNETFKAVLDKDSGDIVGLGLSYVKFATKNPQHFKVMFHPDVKAVELSDGITPLGENTFHLLISAVDVNKRNKKFSSEDSQILAMTAWASVHGLATLIVNESLDRKMKLDSNSLAKLLTKNILNGFLIRS